MLTHPSRSLLRIAVLGLALTGCGDDPAATPDTADTAAPDTDAPDDTSTPDADTSPPAGRVVLNEVACQADPSEWVELANVGDAPIELTGFRIADAPGKSGVRVPTSVLAPGAHVVVSADFGLSCSNDSAYLLDDRGIVDSAPVRSGDPETTSWGRFPDGTGPFVETLPTPQKANRALDDERDSVFVSEGDMPVVDLYVDAEAEASLEADHHTYVPAIWTWTDARGTSAPQRVDIHIKGAITDRPWSARPSLKVSFARHDEPGPRDFRGIKKLALHSMVYDPSTIREWLSYEVFRGMGVPAPRVGWALVRVNGTSKGLYGVIENYDEVFLRDWYPSTVALYEADGSEVNTSLGGFSIDEGDSPDYLVNVTNHLDSVLASGSPATRAMPEIDWHELTMLFGVEDVLQHTDGMKSGCHNFYMHIDDAGTWDFMAWSVDLALISNYGSPGPIGSCNPLAQACEHDEQCTAWFRRARDEAAQLVLRHPELRQQAVTIATRNQAYARPGDEPWTGNEFWNDIGFDLGAQAQAAVDLLQLRAHAIRCATAVEQGTTDPENPDCGGFTGEGPGKPPK